METGETVEIVEAVEAGEGRAALSPKTKEDPQSRECQSRQWKIIESVWLEWLLKL